METFLSLAFLAVFAALAYGASDSKGKMFEIKSVAVDCGQKIPDVASKSADDCGSKCQKDANCRFASYNIKDKKCQLIPPTSDCSFGGAGFDNFELIGFAYKKFTKRDNAFLDSAELKNKKGNTVLSSGNGLSADTCRNLCDIHPNCKAAYYTAAMGQSGCKLLAKAEPVKSVPNPTSTNIVFAAA
ncbi:uncharacterized protein LOC129595280 [Paramacrobiotus metropolitanus]|uniref:uncharacterized protein LOC129595280 n=1 Tax=Paramacrobiotus metropolitanus TaxID=2943436 RepID=UPI0024459888|nr:uncharacterized protein LOC129595280 [Paramacrobiotus metropolitanus]